MAKWKDKLKNTKEVFRARAILAKDNVTTVGKGYHAAMAFNKDKKARAFHDANLKGHTVEECPEIIQKAIQNGEISEEQGKMIQEVIDFAAEAAAGVK